MRKAVETRYRQPASAELDDLQRHAPPHRLGLFGDIDYAAAALADLLQQLVAANRLADDFVGRVGEIELDRGPGGLGLGGGQRFRLRVRRKQGFEAGAQGRVAVAGPLQKSRAAGGVLERQRLLEERCLPVRWPRVIHARSGKILSSLPCLLGNWAVYPVRFSPPLVSAASFKARRRGGEPGEEGYGTTIR